jgi:hypothetical protein
MKIMVSKSERYVTITAKKKALFNAFLWNEVSGRPAKLYVEFG